MQIDYRIEVPSGVALDLNGGRQQYEEGMLRITHEKVNFETGTSSGGEGCGDLTAALPSRYVQSDHPAITALAQTIISDNGDDFQKIKQLASWVYANIDKRPVIGLPDAMATLHSRVGDCNEHAALFAALARSLGIPTRVVAGVTLHQERFYYHAWNEVCVDARWVSLDTTKDQIPADLTHIRLVSGDLEEQVRIGALLGKLRIEIVQ
jgi:transglutaminase-like putative cysteine protease